MTRFRERQTFLRQLLPTARKIQVARSVLSSRALLDSDSILVIGAGDDPYRPVARRAQLYVRVDIDYAPGKSDVLADGIALPFGGSSFHSVISTEVLEYVCDAQRFVDEIYRVLRPGGNAIVTVPFLFNFHNDYWRPTKRALEQLFRAYSSVSICAQGNRLLTIWDLITTTRWPRPVLMPLRVFSNVLYMVPARVICGEHGSSAPTGFFVTATK
jgi:SAM-dependent methyltransferase